MTIAPYRRVDSLRRFGPALRRLAALAPLDGPARAALEAAMPQATIVNARREVITEGQEILRPLLMLEGWAARVRILPDGRRQVISFILPGDLIGNCRQPQPLAASTVVAITQIQICAAPAVADLPALGHAYAVSHALDESYLLAQVTRLGRMTAQERICDLLLELMERLDLAGLVEGGSMAAPLTQETLADATGLTPVHVNRTLQLLRREGEIVWRGNALVIADPDRMARSIGRMPLRVCADMEPFARRS